MTEQGVSEAMQVLKMNSAWSRRPLRGRSRQQAQVHNNHRLAIGCPSVGGILSSYATCAHRRMS